MAAAQQRIERGPVNDVPVTVAFILVENKVEGAKPVNLVTRGETVAVEPSCPNL